MPNDFPPPSPPPPFPPAPPSVPITNWRRFRDGAVRVYYGYANWLVGISWKRFLVLAVLLMIVAGILQDLPPFSSRFIEVRDSGDAPAPPRAPKPPGKMNVPGVTIDKSGVRIAAKNGDEVTISIDEHSVRITPRSRAASAPASGTASAAQSASQAAGVAASGASSPNASAERGVQIDLPPGATSEAVKEAVQQARDAVVEAIEESRRAAVEAAADAREAADDAAAEAANANAKVSRHRTRGMMMSGVPLEALSFLFIVASAILKISYKGRMQAEVKAAAATETAESEQLKRQVVEARMAAMQAQVEPHFLFNTLASIDHLIETDPPRASQMQKNLIALLRASMPAMRENHPAAHNLGREIAVIRPYLEILKVRMEERLQTVVDVPEGLLSADFPSMMIQSLVENAIKHGLEPKPEGGTLTVRAQVQHGKLAVAVADTGVGFANAATAATAGTGVGLANIRERLQLLYGNKASMTVAENSPSGTVVTLTVPYQPQPRDGETA